ncbi:hypothetical protein SEA_TARGET_79 [Mycobacterium phage Target]|nr:hypothetical protein SEA_TARGET_79 [Mycobacterium phage Target]
MNDELRAVLTEALAGHQPENYGFNCSGCDWEPANPAVTDAAEFAAHQLDVLDTAPGVAVIQLPEPSYVDEPEAGMKGVGFNGGPQDTHLSERGVYVHDGLVYDQWDCVTPADALKVAGWWAAAAVVAAGEEA